MLLGKDCRAPGLLSPDRRDGLPLIGRVPGVEGAYATRTRVWGILNAPATGEAIAELIRTARRAIDLAPFDPGRLRARSGAAALRWS